MLTVLGALASLVVGYFSQPAPAEGEAEAA